ncbi:MAG TPA: MBL fold metallo-hydrolase, partial [Desulfatirhabdiaceae bacterium]|nr:MBL fold metallo-hydrolase [Desulfatirhabdiaceae bacterium]
MKAFFWGTRGSLPASFLSEQIRLKLRHVLRLAQNQGLKTQEAIDSFIDRLPFPLQGTYGTNTSCVEIQGGCETIICDAGTGIRDFGQALVKESGGPFRHVFHLFLSHLHWDHIQGFPFFIPAYIPG